MQIRAKIRMVMSVTLLVSLLVMGIATSALNYTSTISTLEQTMTETAGIAAERVAQELEIYKRIAYEVGSIPQLSGWETSVEGKKEIIDQRVAVHGLQRGNLLRMDGVSVFDGKNYTDRAYFQAALKGQSYVSTPLVSKITGELSIMVAAPLWRGGVPNSEVAGVVYFVPKETFLNDIVSSIQIGEKGGCYILDKEGYIIAHQDMDQVKGQVNVQQMAQENPDLAPLAEQEKRMVQGMRGFDQYSYNGAVTLLAYAPIDGTDGWSLAVYADRGEMIASTVQGIIITIVILLIAIAVASFIAGGLAKGISRPIHTCVERMEGLARGDLKTPVAESQAKDETGVLLRSVRDLVAVLNAVIGDVDYMLGDIAQGNFDVHTRCEERYVGDFSGLLRSSRALSAGLSDTMREINQAAEMVSAGSDQVSGSSQSLAQGATEQASSIQELAAAINEISSQVDATAAHASTAKDETALAGQEMQVCSGQMADLVQAMRSIDDKSKEISKVVKIIEDIAFQTNILALNAAVEAARAGSAGKGFAVVADEVRNLAGKSAEAAKNTTSLISETVGAIAQGAQLTQAADASLKKVAEAAEKVMAVVADIDQAAKEEAEAISQVTTGIDQISGVVQTNSATAEESAAASEELSGQAAVLKGQVDRFTLLRDSGRRGAGV